MQMWRGRPRPRCRGIGFSRVILYIVGASVPARALARTPQSDLIHCQIHLNAVSQRTRGRCYRDRVVPGRRSRLPGTTSAATTTAATSSAAILEADHHQDHEQHAKQLPPWSTPHAAESEQYQRDRKRVL